MVYNWLVTLIGEVPEGLEPTVYVLAGIVVIFLLCELFAFLHSVFNRIAEG